MYSQTNYLFKRVYTLYKYSNQNYVVSRYDTEGVPYYLNEEFSSLFKAKKYLKIIMRENLAHVEVKEVSNPNNIKRIEYIY